MKFEQLARLVAGKIKKQREAASLTQERIAKKAGLNYKFYQRVESGRSNLTLKTIAKISNVLKIYLRAFFK